MSLPTDKKARKERPIARGVLDYFPDAIAAVANVSYVGNQQHNPGEEMHWARDKSSDHSDCVARHLIERGTIDDDGLRHSAKLAWRALALLQIEIEEAEQQPRNLLAEAILGVMNDGVKGETAYQVSSPYLKPAYPDVAKLIDMGCRPEVARQIHAGTRYSDGREEGWKPYSHYVYVAGPMRGYEKFNFPAFDAARDRLLQDGWNVISPADIDRASGCDENTPIDQVADQRKFVFRDFFALYFIAHREEGAIAMIPGWEKSTGAVAEFFLARWLGLTVLDATDGRPLYHFNGSDIRDSIIKYLNGQLEK
jgi:hypothetical protein